MGLHRLGEAFGDLRVDHHQVLLGIIQRQGQMGGVFELMGYPIRPSRLIAMITVLWLTSIPALFMFWFSKRLESVRLKAWFPDPEPAPINLVYAGS